MVKSKAIIVFGILLLLAAFLTGYASVRDLYNRTASDGIMGSARGALGVIVEQPPQWYFYSLAVAYLIISIIAIISAIGLLLFKKWSRSLCFALASLGITVALLNLIGLTLLNLFFQFQNSLFNFFISLLFYSLLVYFLTRKDVKREFSVKNH